MRFQDFLYWQRWAAFEGVPELEKPLALLEALQHGLSVAEALKMARASLSTQAMIPFLEKLVDTADADPLHLDRADAAPPPPPIPN